ncbi:hypothetical protein [Loktanella sp. Alg231-35]|uniref:hypothetical protein n=1 Tax=Loktanella sp. Alg231-35 TaxID=1922220 RepID=UPI000D55470D|nr:hypothetical protein [Loktanella sp. Alg231-35]
MIFLRALPFSFSILWRYVIVLPLLIIALFFFGIVAIIPVAVIMLVSPFVGVLVAAACGAAAGVVPIMVGMRVGLQAKRVRPRNSYPGLMLPAIGYGFFEAFTALIILVGGVAAFVFFTPLTPADFEAINPDNTSAVLGLLFQTSPVLTLAVGLIGGGLVLGLHAALLMPMAGAAVGADPSGRPHTPFYGFGSNFFSLFFLVVISQIGAMLVIPIVVLLSGPLGIADSLNKKLQRAGNLDSFNDFAIFGTEGLIFAGLCVFFYLLFFSLQCAGGVLVYMRHKDAVAEADNAYAKTVEVELSDNQPTAEDIDVMALVRSRMQNKDS